MMNNNKLRLVATDLDGTFLNNDKSISAENISALHALGEKGIVRVIATGRNLKKTKEVVPPEIPFDYAVFSSGAGVYDWQQHKLLFHRNIEHDVAANLSAFLIERGLNFHLFRPVPDNDQCWYHRGELPCNEFESYFDFLKSHSEPLPEGGVNQSDACQFLVVFPGDADHFFILKNEIQLLFPEVKVVRTSSPLDTGYIWMEIFHRSVSKGNGVKYVCDTLQIEHEATLGIGNDFNDLDLLEFTNYSYIVGNGPDELKSRFSLTVSNEENAFYQTVMNYL